MDVDNETAKVKYETIEEEESTLPDWETNCACRSGAPQFLQASGQQLRVAI